MMISLAVLAASTLAVKGNFCILEGNRAAACRETTGAAVVVEPSDQPRRFVWRSGSSLRLGLIAPKAVSVRLQDPGSGRLKLVIRSPEAASPGMHIDGGGASWTVENAGGPLVVDLPPAIRYQVSIEAEGLEPIVLHKVRVTKGTITDLKVIELRRYPEISGTIVARKDTSPLAGAAILNGGAKLLATSDERGRFRFQRTDTSLHTISVAYPGYETHLIHIGEVTSDRRLETVQLGEGFTLTVSLEAVPHNGMPTVVKRARLFRTTESQNPIPFLVAEKSVTQSSVVFEDLEAGRYGVQLSGDEPLEQLFVPVDLAASRTIDIAVRPLDVTISALLGDNVRENTVIDLAALRNLWRATINTGASGEYKGSLWQRGLFAAHVHLENWQFFASRTIDTPTEAAWDIVVPDRRISGSVIDADTRRPVPDAGIHYDFKGGDATIYGAMLPVDENGHFVLFGALRGEYEFHVAAPEYAIPEHSVSVVVDDESKESRVEIPLKREQGRMVVFVDAATGGPVAEAAVIELRPDGRGVGRMLTTDDTGRVHVGVQGKETRTVYVLPVSGSIGVAHIVPGDDPLRIEVPPPSSTIHIKTEMQDGSPVKACRVLLRINGEIIPATVMSLFGSIHRIPSDSGSDGDLSLPGMPAGLYELWPYRGTGPAETAAPIRANVAAGASTIVLTFGG
jgi:hypothetical protein